VPTLPTPPAETSAWIWLLAVVGPPTITGIVAILVALITRRDTKAALAKTDKTLTRVAEDAAASRSQTENEHLDAEFPNLREELTAFRTDTSAALASIREDVGGMHSEVRDVRKDLTGIRTDARRDRRKLSEQEQALDEHIADVTRIVEETKRSHVAECPLRQQ
jgi:methyl-accepting chemotaxis protein